MKHPPQEEWMDCLYGELPPARQRELEEHLDQCADCRTHVAAWRAAQQALNAWPALAVARPAGRAPRSSAWIWAAAAVLLLWGGFGLGRHTAPAVDPRSLQAQIETNLRQQIRQEIAALAAAQQTQRRQTMAGLVQGFEAGRAEDRQVTREWLRQHEAHTEAKLAALRQDLETVAVLTDDGLHDARNQIYRLASFTLRPSEK